MQKLALASTLALSTLLATGLASAQTNTYTYATDSLSFCEAGIAASQGQVYGIRCDPTAGDKTIWKRTSSGWQQFTSSTAVQVQVSGSGTPYIRKANGKVYRWDGTDFVRLGPTSACASDLGVGWDNGVWALGCNGTTKRVYQWNGSSWVEPQPSARASHIGVGLDNMPWLQVDDGDTGSAWRWNGSSFQFIDSCVSAVGGGGWVVGCDRNDIWQWQSGVGWIFGGVASQEIPFLANDGSFAGTAFGEVLAQSAFTSFSILPSGRDNMTVSVLGKYFDPSVNANLVWEKANGEQITLNHTMTADASGVINKTQSLGDVFSCTFFKAHGLTANSPLQKVWLKGDHNRNASTWTDAFRRQCF